jgi:hypothetical protein
MTKVIGGRTVYVEDTYKEMTEDDWDIVCEYIEYSLYDALFPVYNPKINETLLYESGQPIEIRFNHKTQDESDFDYFESYDSYEIDTIDQINDDIDTLKFSFELFITFNGFIRIPGIGVFRIVIDIPQNEWMDIFEGLVSKTRQNDIRELYGDIRDMYYNIELMCIESLKKHLKHEGKFDINAVIRSECFVTLIESFVLLSKKLSE